MVQKGLFIVSIDDHSRKHYSNIVVNNSIDKINLNKKMRQIWLTGSKYILVKNIIKEKNLSYKPKKLQLLLHAGGSSSYKYIKDFTVASLEAINKYNLDASILCTSKDSKDFIKKVLKNMII